MNAQTVRPEEHFMVDMSGSTKGWINDAEREAPILCRASRSTSRRGIYLPHLYGAVNYVVLDKVGWLPLKVSDIYRKPTIA